MVLNKAAPKTIVAKTWVAMSHLLRRVGNSMDRLGRSIEVTQYQQQMVPSTRFVGFDGRVPNVSSESFVAPTASVIGNVTIGKTSSIWYSAIVRGDVNAITIGTSSSIGDRAVIHVAKIQGDLPTTIGDHVTICAGAIVHAATIHNAVVIGESAQVMDGAVVETQSIVAPGAVVAPGTIVNSGELWAGNPARKVRDLTDDETVGIVAQAVDTAKLAEEHAIENSKDYEEIMEDLMILELESAMDPTAPRPADYDSNAVLGQGHPGRIFRSTLSHPYDGKRTPDGSPYAE